MSQISTAVAAVRDAIRRHPWWTDSLLALFLTVISVASAVVSRSHAGHAVQVLAVVLIAFTTAPIALRRYRPIAVLTITVSAAVLILVLTSHAQFPM